MRGQEERGFREALVCILQLYPSNGPMSRAGRRGMHAGPARVVPAEHASTAWSRADIESLQSAARHTRPGPR